MTMGNKSSTSNPSNADAKAFIDSEIASHQVVIFSKSYCGELSWNELERVAVSKCDDTPLNNFSQSSIRLNMKLDRILLEDQIPFRWWEVNEWCKNPRIGPHAGWIRYPTNTCQHDGTTNCTECLCEGSTCWWKWRHANRIPHRKIKIHVTMKIFIIVGEERIKKIRRTTQNLFFGKLWPIGDIVSIHWLIRLWILKCDCTIPMDNATRWEGIVWAVTSVFLFFHHLRSE